PLETGADQAPRRLLRGRLEVAELTERQARVHERRDPALVSVEEELLLEARRGELSQHGLAERRDPERVLRVEVERHLDELLRPRSADRIRASHGREPPVPVLCPTDPC